MFIHSTWLKSKILNGDYNNNKLVIISQEVELINNDVIKWVWSIIIPSYYNPGPW